MHTSQSELNEQTTALGITDLRLLHNWTLEAYKGFGDTIEQKSFWQIEVPQLACTHPFLMHSLLAISCLHLARQSTDRSAYYFTIAAEHQDKALPAYRSIISDLERSRTEQKGRAMVAFTKLTTIYAVLSPISADSQLSTASRALTHLIESFSLLRGGRDCCSRWGLFGRLHHDISNQSRIWRHEPIPQSRRRSSRYSQTEHIERPWSVAFSGR